MRASTVRSAADLERGKIVDRLGAIAILTAGVHRDLGCWSELMARDVDRVRVGVGLDRRSERRRCDPAYAAALARVDDAERLLVAIQQLRDALRAGDRS